MIPRTSLKFRASHFVGLAGRQSRKLNPAIYTLIDCRSCCIIIEKESFERGLLHYPGG